MEKTYDVAKAIKAQKDYCNEKKFPHFAPHDGVCFSCKKNIYEERKHKTKPIRGLTAKWNVRKWSTGITVERAGSHITGCPHCSRSYCD